MLTIHIPNTGDMDTAELFSAMAHVDRIYRECERVTFASERVTVHLKDDGQCAYCRESYVRTVRSVFAQWGHDGPVAWSVAGWPTDEPCARHRFALALVASNAEQ